MLIAITGGIGSGKSLVSHLLTVMGYTVYDCDLNAKQLMLSNQELRSGLISLFGSATYLPDGSLNKPHLSEIIFSNPNALDKMNALIHPAVARHLINCYQNSKENIYFYESAILFESHFNTLAIPDYTISVSAPLELRIQRTVLRDNTSREKVLSRINSQMSQEEKDTMSDFVICNDNLHSIIAQITNILNKLKIKQ